MEIALIVPPAIIATTAAFSLLILSLRRMYGIDLEFRTYREEQRAAFYRAKKDAEEAHRAWLAGQDPLPATVLEEVRKMVKEEAKQRPRLKPHALVLVYEDDAD